MAKKTIADLNARLTADITQYDAEMKKAARATQSTESTITSSFKKIGSAAVAYLGFNAMKGYAMNALTGAEALKDLSAEAGVSIDRMEVMSYAARQNGADVTDMAKAMNALAKSMAEAETSAGTRSAFEKLGIDFRTLKGLSPDEQLAAVARQMYLLGQNADTSVAIMDILGGKVGPRLNATLLELGDKGLPGMAKAAKDAGQVMGEEMVTQLDEAKQAIDDLSTRWTIFIGKVIGGVLPPNPVKKFEEALASLQARRDEYARGAVDFQVDASIIDLAEAAKAIGTLESLQRARDELLRPVDVQGGQSPILDAELSAQLAAIDALIIKQREKNAADEAARAAALAAANAGREKADADKLMAEAMAQAAANARTYADAQDMVTRRKQAAAGAWELENDLMRDAARLMDEVATPMERYSQEIDRINTLKRTQLISEEQATRAMEKAVKAYDEAATGMDGYADSLQDAAEKSGKDLPRATQTLGRSIELMADRAESRIAEAFIDTLSGAEDAWKDLGRLIIREVMTMIVQLTIVRPIVAALMGSLGFSGFGGGGGGAAPAPHAAGGRFGAGETMLVGEKGPELVRFGEGGEVITNGRTEKIMKGGASGSQTFVINQTFTGGVTRQDLGAMVPEVVRLSKQAVLDAARRSGSFRAQLAGA